ncbi:MAG: hypothetical protein V1874_01080 [Spirochaetota bacterium]
MKKFILFSIAIYLFTFCFQLTAENKIALKFLSDETWKSEETIIMKGLEPPASRIESENKVVKVFPDGSALIKSKAFKAEAGLSLDKLANFDKSPLLNKEQYKLITPDGKIFIPRPKPQFDNPEEAAASKEFGFTDEIDLLLKSKSIDDFIKINSEPMDSYLIPDKPLAVGKSEKSDMWVITRIKEEIVDGIVCAVFEGKMGPVIKTVYVDAATGRIICVKIKQGSQAEMTYRRLK